MPITSRESTPPPTIGKIGPYTVFVTPPSTSSSSPSPSPSGPVISDSSMGKVPSSTVQSQTPPVQAPPVQFQKPATAVRSPSPDSAAFGFFWNAVTKVQNAHSSLDEYVAHWFGLNQSKYQWALDDYYENKGADQVDAKTKGLSSKVQSV